ncbi:MAG: O-antigen ligase family protein [Candidatus Limnocylindria bacterium]
MKPLNGPVAAIIGSALVMAAIAAAWIATPLFLAVGVIGLAFVAYCAHRWPKATLTVGALATFVDPVLVPLVLPGSLGTGPIGASEPLLAVAAIVIAVDAIRGGTFVSALRDPVLGFVVLLALVGVVSGLVNAVPPVVAALGIFVTVDAIAVYFLARMAGFDARATTLVIGSLVGLAVVVSVFGILQVALHPDLLGFASFAGRFGEGGRITAFTGNPNMVAAIIGMALPFPLFGALHLDRRRDRRVAWGIAILLVLALLLTFSRGAWIAVGLGAVVGALILDRRTLLVFVVAIALAWGLTVVMPRHVLVASQDLHLYFLDGAGDPSIVDSTVDRIGEVYERRDLRMRFIIEGLPIVNDNMWLGIGPGRYGGAAASIIPSPVYEEYGTGLYGFRTVHNFWLHLMGELGVAGITIFLAMIAGLFWRFVMAARRASSMRFVLFAGAATATLTITLNNLTEMLFEGNVPGVMIWLLLGSLSVLAPTWSLIDQPEPEAIDDPGLGAAERGDSASGTRAPQPERR